MQAIGTITWLTFHEAWRRRMVVIALVLGVLFWLLYALGLWLIVREIEESAVPDVARRQVYTFLTLAGLYVIHFLTIMISIFASVGTISGEVATHTIQTIATKPLRRWQIVLGKWLGFVAMICLYLGLLSGLILLTVVVLTGNAPPNWQQGLALLALEAVILVSLSLLGGTRFSTMTNGVALFMLYGLAFIGSWVEQIGALMESEAAQQVGIVSSLLMPVEALWRLAAHTMQPPLLGSMPGGPFATFSVPSTAMVVYAVGYALVALLLAMWSFSHSDL